MDNILNEILKDVFLKKYGEDWKKQYSKIENDSDLHNDVLTALEKVKQYQIEELIKTLPNEKLIRDVIIGMTAKEFGMTDIPSISVGVKPSFVEERIKGALMLIELMKG